MNQNKKHPSPGEGLAVERACASDWRLGLAMHIHIKQFRTAYVTPAPRDLIFSSCL